jgi:DNA-binding transcriptional LysR family regulator
MDLRHLRTFVTVAELGTVSRAALHLHVAQPALSRQLSDLEQELGLALFDRVGRRLFLTGAGEQLLGSWRSLLGFVTSLGEQAQLLRGGDTGVLKVAASPVQIETVFSTFLHQYAQRYPRVQVKLIEAVGTATLALLERGEIHLGISLLQSVQADDRHFGIYPVPPVELLAACHPSFPLASGSAIDIGRITVHPLLLLDSGFVVRKTFDTVCRLSRIKPNILFESGVPHNLLAFAEARLGIAIIPSVVRTHRYTLRLARITHERKPLREPLAVVWDKRRALPRYVQDFCETLAAHMRELARRPAPELDGREQAAGSARGPFATDGSPARRLTSARRRSD